jgi:hypothetical protein
MMTHWAYDLVRMSSMVLAEVDMMMVSVFLGAGGDGASLSRNFVFYRFLKARWNNKTV